MVVQDTALMRDTLTGNMETIIDHGPFFLSKKITHPSLEMGSEMKTGEVLRRWVAQSG